MSSPSSIRGKHVITHEAEAIETSSAEGSAASDTKGAEGQRLANAVETAFQT